MSSNHQNTNPDNYWDLYNKFNPIPRELDEIGKKIVHAAYLVHKNLGPGLLEKVYEICFVHELVKMGLSVRRQIDIPIVYDGISFKEGLRLDVLVEDKVNYNSDNYLNHQQNSRS